MVNRIINVDKNGRNYKKFYNINFTALKSDTKGKDGLFTAKNESPVKLYSDKIFYEKDENLKKNR